MSGFTLGFLLIIGGGLLCILGWRANSDAMTKPLKNAALQENIMQALPPPPQPPTVATSTHPARAARGPSKVLVPVHVVEYCLAALTVARGMLGGESESDKYALRLRRILMRAEAASRTKAKR